MINLTQSINNLNNLNSNGGYHEILVTNQLSEFYSDLKLLKPITNILTHQFGINFNDNEKIP